VAGPGGDAAILVRLTRRPPRERFTLLTHKLDELNAEIVRRQRIEAALVRLQGLTAELAAAQTPADVGHVTVTSGVQALGARAGALFLAEPDGFRAIAQGGFDAAQERLARPIGSDEPWLGAAAAYDAAPVVASADASHALDRQLAANGSVIAYPLLAGSRVIGVLAFGFDAAHADAQGGEGLAPTVARLVSQALERALLFDAERSARLAAHDAERRKDEFLAMLGHELRNPLAPIVTAAEVMRLRAPDVLRQEREVIERQARHLSVLVDDLLDVTRITRGKIGLERRPRELWETIATALETVEATIAERGHQLAVHVPRVGLVVDADHQRLAQIVVNLVDNAAKYTPAGGRITIGAAAVGGDLELRVAYSGEGVSTEVS
jgi:signal transduction histidine kinase